MSLSPGSRLGVYEITAPLGEGGMGEVYRARDTKLNRDVAIKVLPASFAGDPDRLARFEREALPASALRALRRGRQACRSTRRCRSRSRSPRRSKPHTSRGSSIAI